MEALSQFIEMFGNPISQEYIWPKAKLGRKCIVNPFKRKSIDDELLVSFIPMQDIHEDGTVADFEVKPYVKVKKGFTYCEDNDVLFAKITPCMENGKGAVMRGLSNQIGFGSTEFHVLRPIDGMTCSEWLYALTKLDIFRIDASKNMTGTGGQKRVPTSYLENFEVGIPPMDLQLKFASIAQQADKSKFGGFKSQFIEMFGNCSEQVMLSTQCDTFIDGDWIESKDQSEEGIRLIQTGNIGLGFFKDKDDKSRYISEDTFKKLNCTEIMHGDILVSRLPDPIGRACVIPEGIGKAITAVDCTIIRLKEILLPEYFISFTMTALYTGQINKLKTGTTRLRVSRGNLGKIMIPIPPIELQQKFAGISQQADKSKVHYQKIVA